MPHAALCVSGHEGFHQSDQYFRSFNAARSIVCVGTKRRRTACRGFGGFNAARSIVCVGTTETTYGTADLPVSMPHAALCVSGQEVSSDIFINEVSMPHAALCVSGHQISRLRPPQRNVSMPHAALCVSGRRSRVRNASRARSVSMPHAALCVSGQHCICIIYFAPQCFNAARSIVCVGT